MTGAQRLLAAAGALCCAAAVALSAAAMHAVHGHAVLLAAVAAAFAFAHGVALHALAPATTSRLALAGLGALLVGVLLFAGTLAGAAFVGWSTATAPAGGALLIGGWLVLAFDAVRR